MIPTNQHKLQQEGVVQVETVKEEDSGPPNSEQEGEMCLFLQADEIPTCEEAAK